MLIIFPIMRMAAQGLELAKFKEAARELAQGQGLGYLVAGAAAERGGGA